MLCPPSGMSLSRGTQARRLHHGLSLAKLNCQTTQSALHECPCDFPEISYSPPFPLSFIHRAQIPRQHQPGSYPTRAIRPDEEDDGQLRTENSASKPMEPASGQSFFAFCLFSLIVSLLSWLHGNWENPLNAYYSFILRPSPKHLTGNHAPVFQETSKSMHLSVLRTPISLGNKQRHPG